MRRGFKQTVSRLFKGSAHEAQLKTQAHQTREKIMHSKQLQAITQSPRLAMRYQLCGEVPKMMTPRSPLIDLLETYTPHQRIRMIGIRVLPALGYTGGLTFRNGEQLYRWLKPEPQMLETDTWPAESRRIKTFRKKLTEADLRKHCQSWPEFIQTRKAGEKR